MGALFFAYTNAMGNLYFYDRSHFSESLSATIYNKAGKKNEIKITLKSTRLIVMEQSNDFLMVVWVLRHINLCRLFNAKSIFIPIVLLQIIQFSMSTQFIRQQHFYFKLFSLFKQFQFS